MLIRTSHFSIWVGRRKTNTLHSASKRLISFAWALIQSDLSLCCLFEESYGIQLPDMRTAKTDHPGGRWYTTICRFCHDAAPVLTIVVIVRLDV